MERLTWNEAVEPMTEDHWRVDGPEINEHIGLTGNIYYGGKAIDKLAAYEDTGLTPEQIKLVQDNCDLSCVDYKSLEEQGLLIKLPCKVGDTVYYLEVNCMEIHEMRIQGMSINYNSLLILHLGDWIAVSVNDFGKTIFLTREEAEEALRASL